MVACRTPQGVRGLKSSVLLAFAAVAMSHPARGAWIEICLTGFAIAPTMSHPARGAWIEMGNPTCQEYDLQRRTPQGVRGLKYILILAYFVSDFVAPRKGCVD